MTTLRTYLGFMVMLAFVIGVLFALPHKADAAMYTIASSTRFNDDDSADLSKTLTTPTDSKKFTLSLWAKRGTIDGAGATIMVGGSGTSYAFAFSGSSILAGTKDYLTFLSSDGGATVKVSSSNLYRDPATWMHVLLSVDTTQSTAANRVRIYANGSEVPYSATTYPSQNASVGINTATAHRIGSWLGSVYFDGYMSDVYFVDGQALTPSSFGHTDANGYWRPKTYTGTYGTNGFHLNFSNSAALGTDSSGNANNWTVNNMDATDQVIDTPTNGFATLNSVEGNTYKPTYSQGNLRIDSASISTGNAASMLSTVAFDAGGSTGHYVEVDIDEGINTGDNWNSVGIVPVGGAINSSGGSVRTADTIVYFEDGTVRVGASTVQTYSTYGPGDRIMVAVKNGSVWFGKNGTWNGDPAAGTGAAVTGKSGMHRFIGMGYLSAGGVNAVQYWNFGQGGQSGLTYNSASGGYFKYTPPSGFKALSTANLPAPAIAKPSEYFDVLTWAGDGNSTRSITGLDFQANFSWIKNRTTALSNLLYDSVRGAGITKALCSDTSVAEGSCSDNATNGYLSAFSTSGLDLVKGSGVNSYTNLSSNNYVAWNWKESATSGFDIVTYTGTGANTTISHSLGATPAFMIVKRRDGANNWHIWHRSLSSAVKDLIFTTSGQSDDASVWNSTAPTASVFSVGTSVGTNAADSPYVAYLFAEVSGFSSFGSYTGNGSADGPFVYTGFKPAFVLLKWRGSTSNWFIRDAKRDTHNPVTGSLWPNLADAEASGCAYDLLSNGFKLRNSSSGCNGSSEIILYAAFAEQPFKLSAAPGTAAETTSRKIRLWGGIRLKGGIRLW